MSGLKGSTYFGLLAEFGAGEADLEKIAESYLGMSPATAKRKAAMRELPLIAYRVGGQKGPWKISISDLAGLIDKTKAAEREKWRLMNE